MSAQLAQDLHELRKWLNEEPNRPLDRIALARVLAAHEAEQAPQPEAAQAEPVAYTFSPRQISVLRFALWNLMNAAYNKANAAAQDKTAKNSDAVTAFLADAKDAQELRAMLYKLPPSLTAEQERDKLDAERYRWLRDVSVPPHNFYLSVPVEFDGVRYTPDEVDSAIDAAIAMLAARSEKGGT